MTRSDMITTLANQLPRINLANAKGIFRLQTLRPSADYEGEACIVLSSRRADPVSSRVSGEWNAIRSWRVRPKRIDFRQHGRIAKRLSNCYYLYVLFRLSCRRQRTFRGLRRRRAWY